ncbi:MAG: hypothetical protein KatS3mg014_0508 [Actinomycetota bacterium]|nr:MAG: hypothetical protein KatS3mg014_0508 [Actinomycetota bacterium]
MAAPMRRLVLLVATCVLALAPLPARAQSPSPEPAPSVRLRLAERSTWNGPERPVLEVRFHATNEGTAPLDDLTVGLTLFGRVRSRTAYEQALVADPLPVVVVDAETYARDGSLAPGETRTFELAFPLDAPGIDPTTSGIYPVKIDLRSDGVPLAAIRTAVVYLVRPPEQPLSLATTFVLHHPLVMAPDGTFTSTSLEEAIGPSGGLGGLIDALAEMERARPIPLDLVVSPVLLRQLVRMREGYAVEVDGVRREVPPGSAQAERADELLAELRTIAASPAVALSALPLAAPQIPSLLGGSLERDLDLQLELGRAFVRDVLDAEPDPTFLRPPDGVLDPPSLTALAERGVRTLALDPGTVVTEPEPLGFAPPPTVGLGKGGSLVGLVPDPSVQTLLSLLPLVEDPVLSAHALVGELAAIWQEQPGLARGLTTLLSPSIGAPPAFWRALLAALGDAPWLAPARARDLVAAFPPARTAALVQTAPRRFPPGYVEDLLRARRRLAAYRSMLVTPSEEPDRLEEALLLAESAAFLADPLAGLAYVNAVSERVAAALDGVRVPPGQVVTLASRTGTLPIRISSSAPEALRVIVSLESSRLVRPQRTEVILEPGVERTLAFRVEVKTTGRFPVWVRVAAPGGRVIEEAEISVRSTAYNRIALLITVGAALALVLVWARRFLPRRTS